MKTFFSSPIVAEDFLCLNRLHNLINSQPSDQLSTVVRQLRDSLEYLEGLTVGKRAELPFPVPDEIWDQICGKLQVFNAKDEEIHNHCICGSFHGCFYAAAYTLVTITPADLIGYLDYADLSQPSEVTALKCQIGELQAEIEGLNQVRICKNCRWLGVGKTSDGSENSNCPQCNRLGPLHQRTVVLDFGCVHFATKEGN